MKDVSILGVAKLHFLKDTKYAHKQKTFYSADVG
jgi:hypothetical protein